MMSRRDPPKTIKPNKIEEKVIGQIRLLEEVKFSFQFIGCPIMKLAKALVTAIEAHILRTKPAADIIVIRRLVTTEVWGKYMDKYREAIPSTARASAGKKSIVKYGKRFLQFFVDKCQLSLTISIAGLSIEFNLFTNNSTKYIDCVLFHYINFYISIQILYNCATVGK